MQRINEQPRDNWKQKVEDHGLNYHTIDGEIYWDESASYFFTEKEIDLFEEITDELYNMCIDAVEHIIKNDMYVFFGIPDEEWEYTKHSYETERENTILGRFDLAYNNGIIKLLEFNADTPTSLFESSVVQYYWQIDKYPDQDQFNSIHEKLLSRFKYLKLLNKSLKSEPFYFSCLKDNEEDFWNTRYLQDTAHQALLDTKFIYIEDIGWDQKYFIDLNNEYIGYIFKLYPWEWLFADDFGRNILNTDTIFFEPCWKRILSDKRILVILHEMFPDSPYLLKTYKNPDYFSKKFVMKHAQGREGKEVFILNDKIEIKNLNHNKTDLYIYQEYFELPNFNGKYPVVGSWIIDEKPAGLGIREDKTLITMNTSSFVPHRFY